MTLHPLTTPQDSIMPLSSELFTKDGPGKQRLADCAVSHQFNFFIGKKPNFPGTEDAVGRIQTALRSLGFTISDAAGVYGESTAKAVFAFKSAHRPKPILGPGRQFQTESSASRPLPHSTRLWAGKAVGRQFLLICNWSMLPTCEGWLRCGMLKQSCAN
jgi:hypothetical protein